MIGNNIVTNAAATSSALSAPIETDAQLLSRITANHEMQRAIKEEVVDKGIAFLPSASSKYVEENIPVTNVKQIENKR